MQSTTQLDVYLEIGKKKIFAGAIDWPGWCRSGRDQGSALQALLNYGPRYARVLTATSIGFQAPAEVSSFRVVEQLAGNTTTDFGAPAVPPSSDTSPIGATELERFQVMLKACWAAFDVATKSAAGQVLRKGPRGGGRDLEGIIDHVVGADKSYLGRLGWKVEKDQEDELVLELARIRGEISKGLAWASGGERPRKGPRGGIRWTPRYYVRRVAWHVLDHAWEIEDRLT